MRKRSLWTSTTLEPLRIRNSTWNFLGLESQGGFQLPFQQLHQVRRARGLGDVQRRVPSRVLVAEVRTRCQELHHVSVALSDGNVDGQSTRLIGNVDRGTVVNQDTQGVQKACPGCVVGRCDPEAVLDVRVSTVLQKQASNVGVTHHHYLQRRQYQVFKCPLN